MPICRDPEIVKPLLLTDESGTRSILNLIAGSAGGRAIWVRVDSLSKPQAVVCRGGALHRRQMLYMYAANTKAAERVLGEVPRRWKLEFAATPKRLVPAVRRALKKRGRKLNWVAPCFLYVLDSEPATHHDEHRIAGRRVSSRLVINRTHKVGLLKPEDARLIVNYWPHGRNEDYIGWRIRSGPTCAIRRNGKLVAWALTHADGAMGILHVLDKYRGQGMARSITTALAKRCQKAGLRPFLYIVEKNNASINLTESMGFRRHAMAAWFGE